MKNTMKGSLALLFSRVSSGLNVNCTKYLLPVWITPIGLVSWRLFFGATVFWLIGIFAKPDTSSVADRVKLFLLGAVAIFGYMFMYATGLSLTTPVNFAIFNATQPIWVFILSAFLFGEKVTLGKITGIILGFSGVIASAFSQPDMDLASNPLLGNTLALTSSILYAVYLIVSHNLLQRVSTGVMLRYTFLGGAFSAMVVSFFAGFEFPAFLVRFNSTAFAVFAFILVFPTVISYLLIPIGVKYLRTTVVAMYGYLNLVIATVVSFLLGQDRFDALQFVALLLICLSVYMVSVAERK